MPQINLLRALPKTKRNIQARSEAKDKAVVQASKQYGELYFDGPRDYGYGGYHYDGRWQPVANDIIEQYRLKAGDWVLDIGCAKGFLVHDLRQACPGLNVLGIDVSSYALENCIADVRSYLQQASAEQLPFDDNQFDLVISINTIHNLPRHKVIQALEEISRVSKRHAFIQVDSYLTEEQKRIFESWVLTAEYHDYPQGWLDTFAAANYTGDYDWTIINA